MLTRTSTGKRAGPTARDSVIQRNTKRDEDKKRGCGGLGATGLAIKCLQKVGGRKEGGTGQIPAGIRDLVIAHLCRERKNRHFVSVLLEWPTWVVVLLESGLTGPHSSKRGERAQATQWGNVAPEWVGPWRNDGSGASRGQQRGYQKVRSHLPPLRLYMATTPRLEVKKKRGFFCVVKVYLEFLPFSKMYQS